MNIDLADTRELSCYKRSLWRAAPELTLAGALLLPAFGVGAILLLYNFMKFRNQMLVIGRQHVWYQAPSPLAPQVCCKRSDIVDVTIRQTWLQSRLGAGDLIIHCRERDKPIVVEAIADIDHLAKRLLRSAKCDFIPTPHYMQVKVGQARWAPRPSLSQSKTQPQSQSQSQSNAA